MAAQPHFSFDDQKDVLKDAILHNFYIVVRILVQDGVLLILKTRYMALNTFYLLMR